MPLPKAVLKIATLGTDHRGVDLSVLGDVGQPERALLRMVAALKLRERVDWRPSYITVPLRAACESDTQPYCNAGATAHFRVMSKGRFLELLPQWLEAVVVRGWRAPEELLPHLLELGRKNKELRRLITSVIGKRGQWLSERASSQDWRWVLPRDHEARWGLGEDSDRIAMFELLREYDPKEARELVEETWEYENDITKLSLISAFSLGLSQADESFLEAALRDVHLRDAAIKLLARLPESRFRHRMLARGKDCLTCRLSDGALFVALQYRYSKDDMMALDGFEGLDSYQVVHHIIRHIDPVTWCEKWGITVRELIEGILLNQQQGRGLINSLARATVNVQNRDLAPAIFYGLNEYAEVAWELAAIMPHIALEELAPAG